MAGRLKEGQRVSFQVKQPFGQRDLTYKGIVAFVDPGDMYSIRVIGKSGIYEVHRRDIKEI